MTIPDKQDKRPLQYAIDQCSADVAKILVLGGADVMSVGTQGHTALHLAAKYHDSELLVDVMIRGVHPDTRDHQKRTALHYATIHGIGDSHHDVVEKLLENLADMAPEDIQGRKPESYVDPGPHGDDIREIFARHRVMRKHKNH